MTAQEAPGRVGRASMYGVAPPTSPIIGRESEVTRLLEIVGSATRGAAAAIVLGGDAGVGKSRLIAELLDRLTATGTRCLLGHCVNLPDGGLPYLPFVDAFRHLDTASWRWLEPHLRGGAAEPLSQLQLYEATVELLFELAEEGPLCLVVEDVHWADRPSRDLLRYLMGRMDQERLALVLTFRSDDLHRRHPLRPFLADVARLSNVQRLTLDPLPPMAIAELLTAIGPLEQAAVDDIVARAEGNAFFAEELRESSRAAADGPRAPFALPQALKDVLISRLEQLDHHAGDVVGVAAVAGRRVDHEVLAAVTGLPAADLDDALREAVARHVLVVDADTYEFRHALLQEAAYAELLPGERVRLHREYARVLAGRLADTPGVAGELAHHAELSHNLPLALTASMSAAAHAQRVHAPSEAQRHFERVLAWWASVPDAEALAGSSESEVYLRAADAAAAAGDPNRAALLLLGADERLPAETGPEPDLPGRRRRVMVRARLAAARYSAGDDRDRQSGDEAVAMAEHLPVCAERAQARCTQAVLLFVHDREGAAAMAQQGLADAEAAGAANLQAEALTTLARIAERAGDADGAADCFTRALQLARDSGDIAAELRTLFNLAMSRYDAGDLRSTLQWTQRTIERAAATGMTYSLYAHEARGIDVIARYVCGDWDGGLQPLQDADRIPASARPLLEAFSLHIAVGRGLADVPDRLARLRAARHPDPHTTAQLAMLAGGCEVDHLLWQQDPAAALTAYAAAVDVPVPLWGEHYLGRIWLDALALAALADRAGQFRLRGDASGARDAAAQGEAIVSDARTAARLGLPRGERLGAEGKAWLARAEAEWSRLRGERDAEIWRAAVTAFDYGYTYEVARCRWRLAEVLLDRAARGAAGDGGGGDGAAGHAAVGEGAGDSQPAAGGDGAAGDGAAGHAAVGEGAGDSQPTAGGDGAAGDGAGGDGAAGHAAVGEGAGDSQPAAGGDGAAGDGGQRCVPARAPVDEAAELLRLAYDAARSLAARPLADAVAALARRGKVSGFAPAAAASGSIPTLTPREQEVLELLAKGRTNRQLGKELFISEKTASVHVSNIMAKLAVGSRGEAVAIARRRGLL